MKYIYTLIPIFVFLSCCKKKQSECECKNYGIGQGISQPTSFYKEVGYSYDFACINPIDENEIIYYLKDYSNNKFQIVKHNFINNSKIVLIEKKIISQIHWNKNGKIVFASDDYNIWSLNDDGSNLIKHTNSNYNLNPIWLNFSDTLVYQISPDLSNKRTLVYSYNNSIIDSISSMPIEYSTYYDNNQLFFVEYSTSKKIKKINLSNHQVSDITIINSDNLITGITYSKNKIYLSTSNDNIYQFNLSNQIISKYTCGCIWKYYKSLNSSFSEKYILFTKITTQTDNDIEFQYKGSIIITNTEDFSEVEIK